MLLALIPSLVPSFVHSRVPCLTKLYSEQLVASMEADSGLEDDLHHHTLTVDGKLPSARRC